MHLVETRCCLLPQCCIASFYLTVGRGPGGDFCAAAINPEYYVLTTDAKVIQIFGITKIIPRTAAIP